MQLVELQEGLASDPGVAVVGISYDPVDVLFRFSSRHGVVFPLLSDMGSKVMAELGVLSTLVGEDEEYWGRSRQPKHDGLPFPGILILDESGVVVEKHFERSHRNRDSSSMLLRALGRDAPGAGVVGDETVIGGVAVRAAIGEAAVFPNQIFPVDVTIAVDDGMHVYVDPVPAGYQPLEVSIQAPDGVYWDPPRLPPGRVLEIPALGETFNVLEGTVAAQIDTHIHESVGDVTLEVVVRFQACDDRSCEMPAEARLRLPVRLHPKM